MKLSVARAIYREAKTTPLVKIGKVTSDKFGSQASLDIHGDHHGYFLQGNAEGTEWWVAHYVYGGGRCFAPTPQESAPNFVNGIPWVKKLKAERKLAAKIVAKYSE